MIEDLAYTLVGIFSILFLGILVYLHDRKSFTNRAFLVISLSTTFWAVSNYFSLNTAGEAALFWIRLVLFFAAPHAVWFFIFIYNFPSRKNQLPRLLYSGILTLLILIMAASISPWVFESVEIKNGQVVPLPGVLMPLFTITVIGSLLSSFVLMIVKYRRSPVFERQRWIMITFGAFLSYFLIIVTNFLFVILLKNTSFIIFGPLFMVPTFIGMSYAIVRHKMLNVRVIAAEIFTFVILAVSLFEVFISRTPGELSLRILLFGGFFIFGTLLIRGVLREVEQREEMERLSEKLEVANVRLDAAYKKVDKLSRAKSEFISIASHQLRTPLTAIKGYISMVLEGTYGRVAQKARLPMENVYQSNERLINLVNDLLSISRIEAGRMELVSEQADIGELIDGVVQELKITAEKKKLFLKYAKPETPLPKLLLDKDKMRQVFLNLVNNAIKYTNQGEITIKSLITNDKLLIIIADTGEGMTKEDLGKVFQSFSRGTVGTKFSAEGAGLGLYIARKFVEMHRGAIWAESEGKGKGSTFFVELPLK